VLAATAPREPGGAGGIDPDPADTALADVGAVHVLSRTAAGWQPEARLQAPNPGAGDRLGGVVFSLALSSDGSTLAVGARLEDGGSSGLGGDPLDNGAPDAGAVYLY
jgi:hypothetical protein